MCAVSPATFPLPLSEAQASVNGQEESINGLRAAQFVLACFMDRFVCKVSMVQLPSPSHSTRQARHRLVQTDMPESMRAQPGAPQPMPRMLKQLRVDL